jgi:hypothetical protein
MAAAYEVIALPTVTAGALTIFALMPTGANVFIFASCHHRVLNAASGGTPP